MVLKLLAPAPGPLRFAIPMVSPAPATLDAADHEEHYGPLHPVVLWRRIRKDVGAMVGLVIVAFFVLLGAAAPLVAPASPTKVDLSRMNERPNWVAAGPGQGAIVLSPGERPALFGRDVRGRDVLSRVIHGARTSLMVGVAVVIISSIIGVTLGCVAGYAGGWVESGIMRLVDILLAFPFLILALAIVSIFPRTGTWHIALALGLAGWPGMCRLMRAQVLGTREMEFVMAARALGAGPIRILRSHILPNCIGPVVIWFTMGIAGAIMAESSLAFLGLGEDESMSWGTMINTGLTKANFPSEWWGVVFPAGALALLVFGFNLLGDGLQDALNPKAQK